MYNGCESVWCDKMSRNKVKLWGCISAWNKGDRRVTTVSESLVSVGSKDLNWWMH